VVKCIERWYSESNLIARRVEMRFRKIALLLGLLPVCCAVLLAANESRAQKPAAKTKPAATAPAVIGHIRMQDRRVTIVSGGLYTVTRRDGKVVAKDVTLTELRVLDPSAHERVREMVAAGREGRLWAGK
jgi:hypothetical protein